MRPPNASSEMRAQSTHARCQPACRASQRVAQVIAKVFAGHGQTVISSDGHELKCNFLTYIIKYFFRIKVGLNISTIKRSKYEITRISIPSLVVSCRLRLMQGRRRLFQDFKKRES